MGIIDFIRECAVRRQIRRERKLRERCVRYAKDHNCIAAAAIYRFIVRGTCLECNPLTKERKEYVYPNLEGVIHQVRNPEK